MEKSPENQRISRLKRDLNSMKESMSRFEQTSNEVYSDYNIVCQQNKSLLEERKSILHENHSLLLEIQSLNAEIESLNADKVMFRTEIEELRTENDLLIAKLSERDLINRTALEFAKNVLTNNNMNGCVVNSLPSFSEQMVFVDRSNSVTAFGSMAQIRGMRLTQSKEDQIISEMPSNRNSGETTTSDSTTFYDANSHRSSVTNSCAAVRPKACQQNQVSSTISCSKAIQSEKFEVNGSISTNSYTFDENKNLKLRLVKVVTGKVIPVTIAYVESPSSFWLHTNDHEVNMYIHTIQVKQEEMEKTGNSKLTSADITLGMYCAAIYSKDGYWYRAQVIHINYENSIEKDSIKTIKVRFIDWGNTEELRLSKVMKLSNELTQRKQAINCYLQGMILETYEWPKKSIDEFRDAVETNKLAASFAKPHKLDEVLESVLYPVDLMIVFENGEKENICNYLPFPQMHEEEEEVNLIQLTEDTSTFTPETLKSVVNKKVIQSQRSQSSQNNTSSGIASHSVTNFSNYNGNANLPKNGSQSVPQNLSQCVPQSSINLDMKNLQIPPPIVPDSNEGLLVQPTHINNPSEFYVHINDTQVGIAQLDDLDEQLYAYYSDYSPSHQTHVSDVTIDSFWACQYSHDQRWYRSRVLKIIQSKALVSYVDYGNQELIEIKDLMPLTRQFATCPALAVKCCLSSISPNGASDWSEESIKYFTDLTFYEDEHILTAYIGHKPSNFNFDSKLEIFLWTNDSKEQTAKDILINSNLVVQKYAITDNIEWVEAAERADRERTPPEVRQLIEMAYGKTQVNGSSTSKAKTNIKILPQLSQIDSSEDDADWDPMADDAYCDTNNYNMIPDDPATATLGFHPKDRKTCKYFGKLGGCRAKDYCAFLHVNPEQRFAVQDEEEVNLIANDLELEVGSTVIFKVTGIQSPYSFFGILPFGNSTPTESDLRKASNNTPNEFKALATICSELKNYYSHKERKENPNVFHGEGSLVAYYDEKLNNYFRGRVVKNDTDRNFCTVFNLDLGHNLDVERKSVFKLENIFTQFHTLAIQCSLNGVEPFSTDSRQTSKWTEQSIKAFTDWTLDRIFCAHILSGKFDNKISIELIDYSNDNIEYISAKMLEYKFAQPISKQSDDEIYNSDLD